MNKKIVAFGEVVWDILPNGKVLGGTPLNLVYRCNSFNEQGFLLSRVGNDDLGDEAIEKIKELGISDENIQSDNEFPSYRVFGRGIKIGARCRLFVLRFIATAVWYFEKYSEGTDKRIARLVTLFRFKTF
jgi:hypothetical protein